MKYERIKEFFTSLVAFCLAVAFITSLILLSIALIGGFINVCCNSKLLMICFAIVTIVILHYLLNKEFGE